ncbi:hypothetical protein [Intestinibacter bartlettii]|uniref:Internalin-A n=1 Tax=Intestinibacter bartlettii TaxID=261299 RepID=A0ABS6DY34_9FIRM|nr:hypothetical protein [Intestinibacter bartlettii]MBU5336166.1 hypothetical protein [Intestinibacter bartlettii]
MKYIKFCSIILLSVLLIITSSFNGIYSPKEVYSISKNKALSESELKNLFPDANFRNVITRNFKHQEITLNKIASLSGELNANNENIEDLTGISYLENINSFIFWNNNIKQLPKEILNLKNLKSINLANNYITDSTIINELIKNGVDVNSDLNFIKQGKNQYMLSSKYNKLTLKKGETLSLNKLLYKNINEYEKYWEVTEDISSNIDYMISIQDSKILSLEKNSTLKAESPGTCIVKIALDDNFYKRSTTTLKIVVKNK